MQTIGLIAHLANSQISLPLAHIEARFRVTGDLASVEMDQIFEQNAREALNVTYTFPLPGEASVFRCEMHVNDRFVRAIVMEEKEAWCFAEQKKAEGHQTALVEVNRENLFTLELGNVAPGNRIMIRFAYLQPLERLGDQLSLRLPFNPGVRYIPGRPLLRANRGLGVCDDTDQVPDASRISPPRISRDHPGAATIYVRGSFDVDELTAGSLISPSHSVRVDAFESRLEVELAGEEHVPDRDLVLRWQEPKVAEAKPKAWSCRRKEWRYGLVQIRAPENVTAVDEWPQDIYFLLDRSSSMSGENWQQCKKALHAFVHELGPRDRVWITCFESSYQDFSDVPMLRDELLGDQVFQNFEQIGTRGGTKLLPALEHVLRIRGRNSIDGPARLILITGGQVGNEPEILELMRGPQAARLPVHTFGIDRTVNDALLQQLAAESGGRCTLMTPQDDIPAAMQKLGATLRRPVLTNLQLVVAGVEVPSPGQAMPDVHAGEVLLLPVRVKGSGVVRMSALQPNGEPWSMEWDLDLAPLSEIARLAWVKRRIKHCEKAGCGPEAVELAIHHNLLCQGASFVAWDETAKTAASKIEVVQLGINLYTVERRNKTPVANIEVVQPRIFLIGTRRDKYENRAWMERPFKHLKKAGCSPEAIELAIYHDFMWYGGSFDKRGFSPSLPARKWAAFKNSFLNHYQRIIARFASPKMLSSVTSSAASSDLASRGVAEQRDSDPWLTAMKKFMDQKPNDKTAHLAWVKRRGKYLKKSGCSPEAIELAIYHDLLWRGASFNKCGFSPLLRARKWAAFKNNILNYCQRITVHFVSPKILSSVTSSAAGADRSSHGIAEQRDSVPWLAAMKKFMEQKPNIPDILIQQLILALYGWAEKIIGQQRHKMIESWIKNLETSQGGIDELIKMLEPVRDSRVEGVLIRLLKWKSDGYLTPEDGMEISWIFNYPRR